MARGTGSTCYAGDRASGVAAHRGAASPAAGKGRERDRPPRASRWSQHAHTMTFAPGDPAGTPDRHAVTEPDGAVLRPWV